MLGTPIATAKVVENGTSPDRQQRLFGSSSEKLDPDPLQFKLDELLLGKPAPAPEQSGETSAPEAEKSKPAKTRRTKADRFPKNLKILKILIENQLIPDKDQDHLPHYRQSQRFWRRHQADIGRQTLNT